MDPMHSPLFGIVLTWIVEPLVILGLAMLFSPKVVERLRKGPVPPPND